MSYDNVRVYLIVFLKKSKVFNKIYERLFKNIYSIKILFVIFGKNNT